MHLNDSLIHWNQESLAEYLNRIPTQWRRSGQSRLDGLLEYVPNRQEAWNTHPWRTGHTMQIFSLGGAESLDRERIAIVGLNGFTNSVAGNREIMTDSQSLVCEGACTIRVKKPEPPEPSEEEDVENATAPQAPIKPGGTVPGLQTGPDRKSTDAPFGETKPDPHAGVDWGRDELHVKGDAEIRFHSRTFMVTGSVDRIWRGGVVRLASMEGVIAGGFYTRAVGGPSLALSGIMSSDVYGGALKSAACRLLMAGIHYRAAKAAAWACGAYIRRVPFTIEPLFTVAPKPRKEGFAGKMQRLQNAAKKVLKVLRWVLPQADIVYGLLNILAIPLKAIINKIRGKTQVDPEAKGPPRVHVKHMGLELQQLQMRMST